MALDAPLCFDVNDMREAGFARARPVSWRFFVWPRLALPALISLAASVAGEGAAPGMLTFSGDGFTVFVTVEGEPDPVSDPKGAGGR